MITFQLDCTVWPLAQWFNFYFLPPSLRVIYTETINVGHSMFFSRFKHIDKKEREARERALLEEAARTQQMVATSQPADPLHSSHPDTRPQRVDTLLPSDPGQSHMNQKGQVGTL